MWLINPCRVQRLPVHASKYLWWVRAVGSPLPRLLWRDVGQAVKYFGPLLWSCVYSTIACGTEAVRCPAKLCEPSIACLLLHFGAAYWISTQRFFHSLRYFWCSYFPHFWCFYFPLDVYHTLYSFSSSLQACRLPGFLSHSRELFCKVFSSSL